MSFRLLPKSVT